MLKNVNHIHFPYYSSLFILSFKNSTISNVSLFVWRCKSRSVFPYHQVFGQESPILVATVSFKNDKRARRPSYYVAFTCWDNRLLLDERCHPEDSNSTNDGSTKLSYDTTPCDTQLTKQPTAKYTTKKSKYQIHNESHTATFHQLTSAKTRQTSNNNWSNDTPNDSFLFDSTTQN